MCEFSCSCPDEFTGQRCESPVWTECDRDFFDSPGIEENSCLRPDCSVIQEIFFPLSTTIPWSNFGVTISINPVQAGFIFSANEVYKYNHLI